MSAPEGTLPTRTVQRAEESTWRRWPRLAGERALAVNRLLGVSPAGWTLLVLVVVAFVLGGELAWTELRVAAVAGLMVLAISVVFTLGRQTYAVSLELHSRQVVVGERAYGELKVVNTSDRGLWPARIELPVGPPRSTGTGVAGRGVAGSGVARLASFALPALGGRASHDEVFAVPTSRRSVIRVGPARTVRGDPFRLMGREILWTDSVDLFVHPRTVPLPGRPGGFIRDLEGRTTDDVTSSDINFHALREYVPGDDRRSVHWRSTARTGTLMVRQFEETRRSHVVVALDEAGDSYTSDEEFELAVSVAGSISLQAIREENTLSLLTTARQLSAVTPRRTLDELCGVAMINRGSVPELVRQAVRLVPGASIAAVVTGSVPSPGDLRRACTLFDVDVRVVGVQVRTGAGAGQQQPGQQQPGQQPGTQQQPDGEQVSVQTLSNLTLVRVGSLEALPAAMRRAAL